MRTNKKVHGKYGNEKDNGLAQETHWRKTEASVFSKPSKTCWVGVNDWCQEVRGVYFYIWHGPQGTHELLSHSPKQEAESIIFMTI